MGRQNPGRPARARATDGVPRGGFHGTDRRQHRIPRVDVDRSHQLDGSRVVSAVTTTSDSTPKALPSGRYSFLDLVKSEWTKVRTVRSTMWTVGVTIVLGIGIGALVCAVTRSHWNTMNYGSKLSFDAPASSLVGLFVAQFSVGVLGVMVMTAEYSTGTIRATFSAAPKRSRVFAAKAFVFGLLAFVVAELTSFVAFFLGQFLL